jgi:hypothetical protein
MYKKFLVFMLLSSAFAEKSDFLGVMPTLPDPTFKKINVWLQDEAELVKRLVEQDGPLVDYQKKHFENNVLLKKKGILNLSRSNYVFECPVAPELIIKISGPANRLANTVVANGLRPNAVDEEDIKDLKKVVTFQTVSSFPTYYLYERLQKMHKLHSIYIPMTYLYKLPWAPEVIADAHYIILQEKIALLSKGESKRFLRQLNDEQIHEVVRVIAGCGLWDIKNNIRVAYNGKVVIADLEQPNVSNPLKGFNIQESSRFDANVDCGLKELEVLLDRNDVLDSYLPN